MCLQKWGEQKETATREAKVISIKEANELILTLTASMRNARKKRENDKDHSFPRMLLQHLSNFVLKCDCKKDVLLLGERKSGDYKRSLTKSGMAISEVHL